MENNYNEERYNQFIKSLKEPSEFKCIKVVRKRSITTRKFAEQYNAFVNFLYEYFDPSLLGRFETNDKSVVIKKYLNITNKSTTGEFFSNRNEIKLYGNKAIYHELFHMASALITAKERGNVYLGYQCGGHGNGINEGYTELLARRYFTSDNAYPRLVSVVARLEYIIGKDLMEPMYFTTGLKGLCIEMSKYLNSNDLGEIVDFINNTDHLFIDKCGDFQELNRFLVYSYEFLFILYYNKLLRQMENGEIDVNQAIANYDYFKSMIVDDMNYIGIGDAKYSELEPFNFKMISVSHDLMAKVNNIFDKYNAELIKIKESKKLGIKS